MLARAETIALLRRQLPDLDKQLADQVAAELGDLPLATAQAAGGLPAPVPLPGASLLAKVRWSVIRASWSTDTTWALSVDQLAHDSPAAVALLQLAAFWRRSRFRCPCSPTMPSCSMSRCAALPPTPTSWTTSSG